jgi:hypothetical protein
VRDVYLSFKRQTAKNRSQFDELIPLPHDFAFILNRVEGQAPSFHTVVSYTRRYNTADEDELHCVQSHADKSPTAPFIKGGGPQDRGILLLDSIL